MLRINLTTDELNALYQAIKCVVLKEELEKGQEEHLLSALKKIQIKWKYANKNN